MAFQEAFGTLPPYVTPVNERFDEIFSSETGNVIETPEFVDRNKNEKERRRIIELQEAYERSLATILMMNSVSCLIEITFAHFAS